MNLLTKAPKDIVLLDPWYKQTGSGNTRAFKMVSVVTKAPNKGIQHFGRHIKRFSAVNL